MLLVDRPLGITQAGVSFFVLTGHIRVKHLFGVVNVYICMIVTPTLKNFASVKHACLSISECRFREAEK